MPDSKITWNGDSVLKNLLGSFASGVEKSGADILKTAKQNWPVDTGYSKSRMGQSETVRDGDDIYTVVSVDADYAKFVELNKKVLRQAVMANETGSLENFSEKI